MTARSASLAHDFKNHLGTILGFTELLLADTAEDDRHRDDLIEIHKAASAALALIPALFPSENAPGHGQD